MELPSHQSHAQTHFALDDHTDPEPLRAAADGVARRERPNLSAADIAAGSVLGGRYVLDRIIGQGGNSSVFLARDLRHAPEGRGGKNFVAVKLLQHAQRANPQALDRLKREYRQMQSLLHPGIVQVFELGCEGDLWFLTMELVAGETASTWMRKGVSHVEAMKVIRGCCTALDHAHSKGILHGDLKPSNVLVLNDGAVKLIDFGSARDPNDRAPVGSDSKLGVTPCYASREVLMGQGIEQRDDVFSLAVLCYAILSGGGHPFDRKTALDAARTNMLPVRVSSIPERLFEVIARGLAMERASRPASVREFLHELRRATKPLTPLMPVTPATSVMPAVAAAAVPETTRAAAVVSRPTFWKRYRYGLWALSVVALLGVIALLLPTLEQAFTHRDESADHVPTVPAVQPVLAVPAVTTLSTLATPAVVSPAASAPAQDAPSPKVRLEPDSRVVAEAPVIPDSPGIVTFDEPGVVAGTSQPLVAITLRRLQSTQGPAAVEWRLESGSAQPDVDYERLRPQIVRFFEGQSVRTVFVPLIPASASTPAHGSRIFTVALQRIAGGPALGAVARVAVTINPSVSINNSGAGKRAAAQ